MNSPQCILGSVSSAWVRRTPTAVLRISEMLLITINLSVLARRVSPVRLAVISGPQMTPSQWTLMFFIAQCAWTSPLPRLSTVWQPRAPRMQLQRGSVSAGRLVFMFGKLLRWISDFIPSPKRLFSRLGTVQVGQNVWHPTGATCWSNGEQACTLETCRFVTSERRPQIKRWNGDMFKSTVLNLSITSNSYTINIQATGMLRHQKQQPNYST